jgi:hypothetical protein
MKSIKINIMRPLLSILLLILFFNPILANADQENEVCGGTFQSFWRINFDKKSLELKAFYRHPEDRFCEYSMTQSPNAEIFILDSSKNNIRNFKTYISTKTFQDVMVNNKLSGSIHNLTSTIFQIKFADDINFKKAKFIRIVFADGSIYGPSAL